MDRNEALAIVGSVYMNLLYREPDAEGLAYWTENMVKGLVSRDQLEQMFKDTQEYTDKQKIADVYRRILLREPDAEGVRWYYANVTQKGWTYEDIEPHIKSSKEYAELIAKTSTPTPEMPSPSVTDSVVIATGSPTQTVETPQTQSGITTPFLPIDFGFGFNPKDALFINPGDMVSPITTPLTQPSMSTATAPAVTQQKPKGNNNIWITVIAIVAIAIAGFFAWKFMVKRGK